MPSTHPPRTVLLCHRGLRLLKPFNTCRWVRNHYSKRILNLILNRKKFFRRENEALDKQNRGKSVALHLLHQFRQLGTEAGGLGFVFMHDGIFKQRT